MLLNLLASEDAYSWVMVVILLGVMFTFMVLNSRSQKKRAQETQEMLNAIGPGNKVKTIGGICGVIVEVCDDGTFVLETGTEASGKSFIKFDKQAIYQTDAQKVEMPAQTVETPAEAPVEENTEASVDEKVEATWEK
jgi:preprotein translocase subunit YajC